MQILNTLLNALNPMWSSSNHQTGLQENGRQKNFTFRQIYVNTRHLSEIYGGRKVLNLRCGILRTWKVVQCSSS